MPKKKVVHVSTPKSQPLTVRSLASPGQKKLLTKAHMITKQEYIGLGLKKSAKGLYL